MEPVSDRQCVQPDKQQLSTLFVVVELTQGLYYLITAIWSLVSINSFQKVTGPKTDLWLVKTVGMLVGVIGGILCRAGLRRTRSPDIPLLAVGSAAGLTAIDLIYVARGRIARIYLLDALAECLLIMGWTLAWREDRKIRQKQDQNAGRRSVQAA